MDIENSLKLIKLPGRLDRMEKRPRYMLEQEKRILKCILLPNMKKLDYPEVEIDAVLDYYNDLNIAIKHKKKDKINNYGQEVYV